MTAVLVLSFTAPAHGAFQFLTQWSTGNGPLSDPRGIGVDDSGFVYVADTGNHRVLKFEAGGEFVTGWGTRGASIGQFESPEAVSFHRWTGTVLVADTGNHRVQVFDANGGWLATLGSPGGGNGQLSFPAGVAGDPFGDIWVADTGNHRIQKFGAGGQFLAALGGPGSLPGQFSTPRGLAVDESGRLLVADSGNDRIQSFDDGLFLTQWGTSGSGDGQLEAPGAVAAEPGSQDVFVADTANHRIQEFDSTGSFLRKFGSFGPGGGLFDQPGAVGVDQFGNAYVADTGNGYIQKFGDPGTLIVVKDARPDDAQDFALTSTGGLSPASFSLDDDADPVLSNTRTFSNQAAGRYSIAETIPSGWSQTTATCSDGSPLSAIVLQPGETVTCQFINSKDGRFVVVHDTNPDHPNDFTYAFGRDPPPPASQTFDLDDDDDPTLPRTRSFEAPAGGSYSITAHPEPGWRNASATCDNGRAPHVQLLDPGQTVTCTFFWRPGAFPRPGGATPLRVPLVPAFAQCTSPNSQHIGPLDEASCEPPVLQSTLLTTSSTGQSNGLARLDVVVDNAQTTAVDETDVRISASASDVRQESSGSDYVGPTLLSGILRITDLVNGPPFDASGTVQDLPFRVPVQCVATSATGTGSNCVINTSANAQVPGFAVNGRRAVTGVRSMDVLDAGADATIAPPSGSCPPTCGSGDEQVYLTQGVFTP